MTPSPKPPRVRAFDWVRGLSVPLMIQCHALVLLRPELRTGDLTKALLWLDGLVAPAFLLSAGFAVAYVQLYAAAAGNARSRRLRGLRRIGEILVVATLVNWMWFPIFREPHWILRMDILQCIGVCLLLGFLLVTALSHSPKRLLWVATALAVLIFFTAPFAERVHGPWAMLFNKSTGAVFPLTPWLGHLFLGISFGTSLQQGGTSALRRWLLWVTGIAAVIWALGLPVLAKLYPPHSYGTFNPGEHGRRIVVLALATLALMWLETRPAKVPIGRKILEVFGTSSMAAYFFHEALLFFHVFGFSYEVVWGNRVGWPLYWVLVVSLWTATYVLCAASDVIYRRVDAWLSAQKVAWRKFPVPGKPQEF